MVEMTIDVIIVILFVLVLFGYISANNIRLSRQPKRRPAPRPAPKPAPQPPRKSATKPVVKQASK